MKSQPWFNARKAAQIVAYFANMDDGNIGVMKVVKLVYLADRECMEHYGYPMLNDRLVSMPHGPVNSITYDHIGGMAGDVGEWNEFVSARANNTVGVALEISDDDLDELSDAELQNLSSVWDKFGHMSGWELRMWTHKNCPEWEDPDGSSDPIPHERVLKYLGHENADELADEISDERNIEVVFEACH